MNKTAIKNFAVWARRKLIADITYKAGLIGVSENGIAEPLSQSTKDMQFFDIGTKNYAEVSGNEIAQRNALVSAIKAKERDTDYKTAFQNVVEEVAYTWFNRLIAVRFMEVNDYLPSRVRVLSSENSAKLEPDFVTTPFDTDLEFTPYEQDRVLQLKDENKLDELFRMLFIKQCNKLNDILPELFEKTDDYSELLLTISFTDKDGVVYHLTHDISEDDFNVSKEGQVEIIGWMYQYYNTEPKDEVFALLKKNVKITKERIPAATQLFTPDWIVRYMVENSLGRIYIDKRKNEGIFADGRGREEMTWQEIEKKRISNEEYIANEMGWKYYLPEAEQTEEVRTQLNSQLLTLQTDFKIENLKIIDPCMGSGHILVYAFDVLMQIYTAQGYVERDAAKSIIENNIFGLDIDTRAYQLAYFAVMMKARQYNRRILNGEAKPNLYAIDDSSVLKQDVIDFIANGNGKLKKDLQSIADDLYNAKEYGSIIDVAPVDFAAIYARIEKIKNHFYEDIFGQGNQRTVLEYVLPIIKQAETMAQKYDVVVTNPPYMGGTMNAKLSEFLKAKYSEVKSDLYAAFIVKCQQFTKENGFQTMVVPESWMFLSTYNSLRNSIYRNVVCSNMLHLGTKAFECGFGTVSFVFQKLGCTNYIAKYVQLNKYQDADVKSQNIKTPSDTFKCSFGLFEKLPNEIMAYWCPDSFAKTLQKAKPFGNYHQLDCGIKTGKNELFLRLWYEVDTSLLALQPSLKSLSDNSCKWFKYNKGGGYQRWYGGYEYVVNLANEASDIKSLVSKDTYRLRNRNNYFHTGIIWPLIGDIRFSSRYLPNDVLIDVASNALYFYQEFDYCAIAFMNSCVFNFILNMINPTVSYPIDSIAKVPYLLSSDEQLVELSKRNISMSKEDWDSFETSWDFVTHPLITYKIGAGYADVPIEKWQYKIADAFKSWESNAEAQFNTLKANEEELNRIFIDIYGLQDELTPDVADKDVTVRKADLQRDIKSLISYAVGCMFGRYSLDVDGLAYAGGDWDASKYTSFIPDADNCIPITDEDYFHDDIVGRFAEFIKTVYGEDTLEENLDFIAKALGNKGNTSREIIRNYFLNDFIKDHIKIYQKRPIYWMFDSGKQNGFKALVYMHRWNADTTGNVRVEYLHKVQKVYESEIIRMQDTIENSTNGRDVAAAEKRKEKLTKQLKEAKDYDAKIAHLALSRIAIDLDDGVKVNYEKVQTGQDGKKIEILTKI